ncbi:MAG: LysR substrate-binding protein [Gemmatimonadetes bacterium]|nr:LysR substrate-binding protein [Gemmatimonadota bacterium]
MLSSSLKLSNADLQFFSEVAVSNTLGAAARALSISVSAVSQRLSLIEQRLGVRLVERSGRQLRLTDEGEVLLVRGRAILNDLVDLTESLASRRGVVTGHLRVLAPLGFGRRYVARAAGAFAARHVGVTLDLMLSDRLGHLHDGGWDLAIHIGVLRDSSLAIQRLAPNQRFVCASPEYLGRHGTPESPAELKAHACIALRENEEDVTLWHFTTPDGSAMHVRIEPRLSSNDGEVVRRWALDGHGIIMRSEWSVARDLAAGRLVRLLPAYDLPDADIVAFVGPRGVRPARTTHFLQWMRTALTPPPWRPRPVGDAPFGIPPTPRARIAKKVS